MTLDDYKKGFHIGMHGMGFIGGIAQNNTREAFAYWYSQGVRFFETDLTFTDDGEIVLLAHNFTNKYLNRLGIFAKPNDGAWTEEYIKSLAVENKQGHSRLLFWNDLVSLIKMNQDTVFMLDTYDRNLWQIMEIAKKIHDMIQEFHGTENRILLEVYAIDDCEIIKERYPNVKTVLGIAGTYSSSSPLNVKEYGEIIGRSIDFVSCPYSFFERGQAFITFCNTHDIGIISCSRYDTQRKRKIVSGINVNLVDVFLGDRAPRKFHRIPLSILEYLFHRGRLLLKKSMYKCLAKNEL